MIITTDLKPDHVTTIASVVSRYSWKAVIMLAEELDVHVGHEPEDRKVYVWRVIELLIKWVCAYKYDEPQKNVLARKLIAVNTQWRGKYGSSKEDGQDEPKFKRLARQLDMQGNQLYTN